MLVRENTLPIGSDLPQAPMTLAAKQMAVFPIPRIGKAVVPGYLDYEYGRELL